jgi:hypothetical protein
MTMRPESQTELPSELVRTSTAEWRSDITASEKMRNMRDISCVKAPIDSTLCLHPFERHPPSIFHEDMPLEDWVVHDEDSSGSTCWRVIALEPWVATETIRNIPHQETVEMLVFPVNSDK